MEQRMLMAGGGALMVRWSGTQVRLEAVRPRDDRGLYKVWLEGEGGGRMLLGTMIPEGDTLRLCRLCSVDGLKRGGCWPPNRAEGILAFPFAQGSGWRVEPHPERYTREAEVRRLSGPAMSRQTESGPELAVPFRTDNPFPLPALFCLARVEELEGRPHLIWRFDRSGRPELPGKPGGEG